MHDVKCTLCPLWESALMSNCMSGVGPMGAEIMLVGQGPGGYEDGAGEPFVGLSGLYLNEMLRDAGIDRAQCYVTNATRCRPPLINKKERAPTPDEINTCRRYLIEEVQRVRPKAIVALGDAALRSLCKTSGVKAKRGKQYDLHPDFGYACPVFVTYHPSAVRRTQPLRPTVVSDLRRVRDRHREADPISWVRGVPWATGKLAYDIECIDEFAQVIETPTQVAIAQPDKPVIVGRPEMLAVVSDQIISHFGWDFDDRKTGMQSTRDTAALAYLDDENQPLGLESLCVKYLGKKGWKEDREGAELGSDALAEYNARDASNTLELHDHLVGRLGPRIKIADDILLPARLALNQCTRTGLPIDLVEVLTARARFADAIMEARVRCRAIAGDAQLNPGSYAQVALTLRGRGHDLPKTDHNNDATDKAVLSELHDEFATAVIEYREAVKMDSTYGRPYEAAARSDDGRMHNLYTIIRTVTGRTSAVDENVQNLPRALRRFLKDIDIADYSGIEFRLAAWLAQEREILDRYAVNPRWDPHTFFAARLFQMPEAQVSETQRQIGKTGNFSQLFLGTPETLVEYGKRIGVNIAPDPARLVNRMFPKIYPGFATWWTRVLDEVKEQGYVESPTGRRRHFGQWNHFTGAEKLDVWRQAVNAGPQSLTADLALLGLACCHRAGLPICGFFHDAIAFDRTGKTPYTAESIRRCMVDEPLAILRDNFGVDITIPIEIDIKSQ